MNEPSSSKDITTGNFRTLKLMAVLATLLSIPLLIMPLIFSFFNINLFEAFSSEGLSYPEVVTYLVTTIGGIIVNKKFPDLKSK